MSPSLSLETVDDAAKLIACGLQPRLRPAASPEYAELLRRYTQDGILRRCAETIARGLGLQILGHTSQGLVLGADDDGPFVTRLSDYRKNMTYEERVCHGLVHLAIAAWCFPTAPQLEDDDSAVGARFSSAKIVQFLADVCDELHKQSERDAEAQSAELREAWRIVRERPETRTTPDKRRTAHTLHGMVEQALEALERGGLMRKVADPDGNNWQALGAYRLHVREMAAYEAYQLVCAAGTAVADRS